MKKNIIAIGLSLLLSVSAFSSCGTDSTSSDNSESNPPVNPGQNNVLELPESWEIPDKIPTVKEPERPVLTDEVDATQYPVVKNYQSTTSSYVLNINNESGVTSISYPVEGGELIDYNFIYVDVENYSADYHYLRIDFDNIIGVEKVAVAACYNGQKEDQPAVGILVQDVFDGSYSFVSDLSKFNTVQSNYDQSDNNLAQERITRLYMFFDSNPCQNPLNKEGSLDISNIGFYKEGDKETVVDNSPKPGEITTSNESYTLALKSEENIFSVNYENVPAESYVRMEVRRYSSAYCMGALTYKADNAKHVVIKNGDKVVADTDLTAEGEIPLDFREVNSLKALDFYIDNDGNNTGSFTLTSFVLKYTPYVTAEWEPTGNMTVKDCAVGGIGKATYDETLHWDYLRIPVKNFIPDYGKMIIKFKSYSDNGGGTTEFIGFAINSNDVLVELHRNPVSRLPFNEKTNEWTMTVDLSEKKNISSLNFYFDANSKFTGTRTIEFTSIEFISVKGVNIGEITQVYGASYDITKDENNATVIKWGGDVTTKAEWDYLNVKVSGYTPDYGTMLNVVVSSPSKDTKVGILRRDKTHVNNDLFMYAHTPVGKANEDVTIQIPLNLRTDEKEMPKSFELLFYFDAGLKTEGSITIKSITITPPPKDPEMVLSQNLDNSFVVEGNTASWGTAERPTKGAWSYLICDFTSIKKETKCIRMTLSTTDKNATVGFYPPVGDPWYGHQKLGAENKVIDIPVAEGAGANFTLNFYVYGGTEVKTPGSITIEKIEYLNEMPEPPKPEKPEIVGPHLESIKQNLDNAYVIDEETKTISWQVNKGQWSMFHLNFKNIDETIKTIKITVTCTDLEAQLGLHYPGNGQYLYGHAVVGSEAVIEINVPAHEGTDFSLNGYINVNIPDHKVAGSITITNIEFVTK